MGAREEIVNSFVHRRSSGGQMRYGIERRWDSKAENRVDLHGIFTRYGTIFTRVLWRRR